VKLIGRATDDKDNESDDVHSDDDIIGWDSRMETLLIGIRSAFSYVICVTVSFPDKFLGFLTYEGWTYRLSRKVSKEVPLHVVS
jgi:hypothetical protein